MIGSAAFEAVEPGICTVGLMQDDPMKMHVHTYDVSGKPAKRSFHLACVRDELNGHRIAFNLPPDQRLDGRRRMR